MNTEMFEASELMEEWESSGLVYKLLEVPRSALDEGDEGAAHWLIGIDSGNVRRVDLLIDTAYSRFEPSEAEHILKEALVEANNEVKDFLSQFLPEQS